MVLSSRLWYLNFYGASFVASAREPVVKGPELPEKYRLLGLAGVILSSKLVPGTMISLFSAGSSEFVEVLSRD